MPGSTKLAETAVAFGRGPIDHELMGEMASALGRAGDKAEGALERFRGFQGEAAGRVALRREAAAAVHAYFIQREMCGLRRHDQIIREMAIPRDVLVRLGAG